MTTDRSRRRVRWTAIGGTALLGVGAAVAIGANPYPQSERPEDPQVAALEQRERALASEARRVNAANAERWATYRVQLAERNREIAAVNAANAATPSSGGSYSAAPAATYVPSAPVASSSSS